MITKINSRTPEEIKKGLALCKRAKGDSCDRCPYQMKPLEINTMCIRALENDALAYVQQLERSWDELFKKAKRLEAERDAAVKDLGRSCATCKYFNPKCAECTTMGCFNVSGANSKWQWRGVQEVNGDAEERT